ncbi:transposase [Deinococcus sp. 23YEL01]|uniref:transposase n=1 Tax=Deinococcus sp. 23YEL01 TaxID=2745871 RepID=UPI001E5CE170|nr:transposase [Deinococcus sp. 23YEL01]MCD0168047.1 transposase [Deinococcus sp. 23YEL01]
MKTRQFTEAQSIQLLQDAQKGEKSVEELCRDFGCSPASFYAWRKKYGDTTPDEAKRLHHLEKENARLLRIVGVLARTAPVWGLAASSASSSKG